MSIVGDRESMRGARRRGAFRAARIALLVLLVELALRLGVLAYANLARPLACGPASPTWGRLFVAYRVGGGLGAGGASDRALVADPHRGHKMASSLRASYPDNRVLTTNQTGARGRRDHAIPKPSGVLRIVVLGDSITLGHGVGDHETWPAQLEALLPGSEVVNLGCEAYAHDQMLFALRDDGLPLQPDVVVLGFHEPDMHRNVFEFYCHDKPRYQQRGGEWHIRNHPIRPPAEVRRMHRILPMLYLLPRVVWERILAKAVPPGTGESEAAEILGRCRRLVEEADARFVVVRLPMLSHPEGRAFFPAWCQATGADCIDTLPAFEQAMGGDPDSRGPKGLTLADGWHYGPQGHQLVAQVLRDHLISLVAQSSMP